MLSALLSKQNDMRQREALVRGGKGEKREETTTAMASADLSYLFQRVQSYNRQPRVGQIMREVLPEILLSLETNSELHCDTGCFLADIGGFLVNILAVASRLAETLVNGDYISNQTTQLMSLLASEPDLRSTDYLDDKHEALEWVPRRHRQLLRV